MKQRALPLLATSVLAVALALRAPAFAQDAEAEAPRHPRVGLALSGGSARGLAQIGVLTALSEAGIPVDLVAGTSMGAVIGALYASGYPPAEIDAVARSIEWRALFSGRPQRTLVPISERVDEVRAAVRLPLSGGAIKLPQATESDHRLNRFLSRYFAAPDLAADGDFDRLPRPFRVVAMDLHTGERVVLSGGSLPRAVRASMAFPVQWLPVPWGDQLLVDGGLVDNLPVDVARAMGAEVVVAVDTTEPPLPPEKYATALGVAGQVADMLRRRRNEQFAAAADVTIRPPVETFEAGDYDAVDRLIAAGREEAMRRLPEIQALLGARTALPVAAPREAAPRPAPTLAAVRVEGQQAVRELFLRRVVGLQAGRPFDLDQALRGMDAVHATRLFESSWLEVDRAPEGVVATVNVRERPHLALEPGGGFNEADKAVGRLALRHRNVFGGGEDFRLLGEASDSDLGLHVSLSADRLFGWRLGAFMQAALAEERPRFFRDHELVTRAEFDRREVEGGLQHAAGHSVLLRGSMAYGTVEVLPRAAPELFASADEVRLLKGRLTADFLDDLSFPTRGVAVDVTAAQSLTGLGATHSYGQAEARVRAAVAVHERAVLEARLLGGLSGDEAPVYEWFRLGGPDLVPGLHRGELWERQALAGSLAVVLRVAGDLRFAVAAGGGNVWSLRGDVSLSDLRGGVGATLAHPTPIGPMSIGLGRSGSHWTVYGGIGYPDGRR
jgi:NTE family protein